MGFMDKAKKMAEQAQEKLDDVQTQFNEKQSGQASQGAGQGGQSVTYDKHGRPVESTPDPTAAPASAPDPGTAAEPPAEAEQSETAEKPAAEKPSGDANASPDPFKPIE